MRGESTIHIFAKEEQFDIVSLMYSTNLKPKQQKQQLKIKKPLMANGLGNKLPMNIQQCEIEVKKYLDVLENVSQQGGRTWIAQCPNKEMHSNNDRKRSFTIAITDTRDENKARFGEHMITFCCFAHKGNGCSNRILANKFKELNPTIKLGQTKQKKKIEPHYFPQGDESFLEINSIRERSDDDIYYFKNQHGHIKFLYWKNYNKTTKSNDYLPLSFSMLAGQGLHPRYNAKGEIEGGWVEEQLWEDNRPFYRMDELAKSSLRKIAIFEGMGVADVASKLKWFEDYFCTAYAGGATTWKKTNWDGLEKFDEIISVGDNDLAGQEASKELTLYLRNTKGYKAFQVVPPAFLEKGWDFKDRIPEELNVEEMLANKIIPIAKVENDYTTIDADILRGRWTDLEDSRKYLFDHFRRKVVHKEKINDWYEADTKVRRGNKSPVKYLHSHNIDRAEGLAYIPSDQKEIYRDGLRYINSYKPAFHVELTADEIKNIDNTPFLRQVGILTNFDAKDRTYLMDIVATLIQTPWINIKYATVLISKSQGTGKNYFLTSVFKMIGGQNCKPLETDQITKPLGRSWMKDKHVLICSEYEVVGTKPEIKRQINTTKTLITDEIHSCEPKGVDPFTIHNQFTIFLASNENAHVMIDDIESRRWACFESHWKRDIINAKFPTHFEEMENFVNDDKKIAGLLYYFKHQYKISEGFKSHVAVVTQSKRDIVGNLKSQLHRNLEEVLLERKLPLLKNKDVVDTRKLYKKLREEPHFANISEADIRDYANKNMNDDHGHCWEIANGEAVTLIAGDSKSGRGTRHYFGFANKEYWRADMEKNGLRNLKLHMIGKFHVPEFGKQKQEELYDTQVSHEEPAKKEMINEKG